MNLHPGALERLISGYSSHSFVIDLEEARELFVNVREPSGDERTITNCLGLNTTDAAHSTSKNFIRFITMEVDEGSMHGGGNDRQESDSEDPEGAVGPPEGTRTEHVGTRPEAPTG